MKYLILIMTSLLVGCGQQTYSIQVWNETLHEINDVTVSLGPLGDSSFGVLPPNIYKVNMSIRSSPPDKVVVSWRDHRGLAHNVTVIVEGLFPWRYHNGLLDFVIENGGKVRVAFSKELNLDI